MDNLRDRGKFARMLTMKAAVGLMVGATWYHMARPFNQSNVFAIQGALFINISNGVLGTLATTIISFPLLRNLLLREYLNGAYSLVSFYAAMIITLAMFAFFHVLVLSVPIYLLVGFPLETRRVLVFFGNGVLCSLIGNALGIAVGAASKDLVEAQNMLAPLLAPFMLFSGYGEFRRRAAAGVQY